MVAGGRSVFSPERPPDSSGEETVLAICDADVSSPFPEGHNFKEEAFGQVVKFATKKQVITPDPLHNRAQAAIKIAIK